MHQRAKHQQAVGENSQQMRLVFFPEKKRRNGEKPKKHQAASRMKPRSLFGIHKFFLSSSAKIFLLGLKISSER